MSLTESSVNSCIARTKLAAVLKAYGSINVVVENTNPNTKIAVGTLSGLPGSKPEKVELRSLGITDIKRLEDALNANKELLLAANQCDELTKVLGLVSFKDGVAVVGRLYPRTLAAYMMETAPLGLPEDEAIGLARNVAEALRCMQKGAEAKVHQDLKPSNIMVDDTGTAYLANYVFQKRVKSVQFQAPEQLEARAGAIGPWTDVWALGCLIIYMLTGKPPYGDMTPEAIKEEVIGKKRGPKLPESASQALQALLARMLNVEEPRRRPLPDKVSDELDKLISFDRPLKVSSAGDRRTSNGGDRRTSNPGGDRRTSNPGGNIPSNANNTSTAGNVSPVAKSSPRGAFLRSGNSTGSMRISRTGSLARASSSTSFRLSGSGSGALKSNSSSNLMAKIKEIDGSDMFKLTSDRITTVMDSIPQSFDKEGKGYMSTVFGPRHLVTVWELEPALNQSMKAECRIRAVFIPSEQPTAIASLCYQNPNVIATVAQGSGKVALWDWKKAPASELGKSLVAQPPRAYDPSLLEAPGFRLWELELENPIQCVAFHPVRGGIFAISSVDGLLKIFEWKSQNQLRYHRKNLTTMAFQPALGANIAVGLPDGHVEVLDWETGDVISDLPGHTKPVTVIKYSPLRSELLFTAGNDGTARVWNWREKKCLSVLHGHTKAVGSISFNSVRPDIVATASLDGTCRVWDWTDGRCLYIIKPGGDSEAPTTAHVAWVPDDPDHLVAGGNWGKKWEADPGKAPRASLILHKVFFKT